ncbi:ThiF family adenylyltransferase [Streptomyces sp. TR02-1]|uniref:ThiF family adenylyltransferase n=1 Tax=Streptomyces sp. TR02-1 TaxID=3385977 RepID=UPI0039A1E45E
MLPLIKPALRRCWRDRRTVQYGVAPSHAVLLEPVQDATAAFLDLLDGTRSVPRLREEAHRLGLPAAAADGLLERLAAAGVLDDAGPHREVAGLSADRLRADLASLSAVHREPGGAPRRLAARRTARVRVQGAGRVGAAVAVLLSAAGVGQVDVVDRGRVEPWEALPGGIPAGECGERREDAARRAVAGARPWSRRPAASALRDRDGTGLVVLAPRDPLQAWAPDPSAAEQLLRTGTPHLYTGVLESTGFVGPLVLPGASPCAECLLRSRADAEPSWALMAAQWRTPARRGNGVGACDAALATAVAGITACHVLSFLDGDGSPGAGSRTCLALPHLLTEHETFAPHRDCPCGAAGDASGTPPSARVPAQDTMTV